MHGWPATNLQPVQRLRRPAYRSRRRRRSGPAFQRSLAPVGTFGPRGTPASGSGCSPGRRTVRVMAPLPPPPGLLGARGGWPAGGRRAARRAAVSAASSAGEGRAVFVVARRRPVTVEEGCGE